MKNRIYILPKTKYLQLNVHNQIHSKPNPQLQPEYFVFHPDSVTCSPLQVLLNTRKKHFFQMERNKTQYGSFELTWFLEQYSSCNRIHTITKYGEIVLIFPPKNVERILQKFIKSYIFYYGMWVNSQETNLLKIFYFIGYKNIEQTLL